MGPCSPLRSSCWGERYALSGYSCKSSILAGARRWRANYYSTRLSGLAPAAIWFSRRTQKNANRRDHPSAEFGERGRW